MKQYLPSGSNSTKPYTFRTARIAGDHSPFTVAVVVDMGTFGPLGLSTTTGVGGSNPLKPGEHTTIQTLSQQLSTFDFLVHPGDLGYADAWLKEEIQMYLPNTSRIDNPTVYEHINNAFYDELVNITSYKPYMVSPGKYVTCMWQCWISSNLLTTFETVMRRIVTMEVSRTSRLASPTPKPFAQVGP